MDSMATGVPIGSQRSLCGLSGPMKLTVGGKQTQIASSVWVWYAVSEAFEIVTAGLLADWE